MQKQNECCSFIIFYNFYADVLFWHFANSLLAQENASVSKREWSFDGYWVVLSKNATLDIIYRYGSLENVSHFICSEAISRCDHECRRDLFTGDDMYAYVFVETALLSREIKLLVKILTNKTESSIDSPEWGDKFGADDFGSLFFL